MKRFSNLFLIFTFMASICMAQDVKSVLADPTEDYVVDVIEPQTHNFEATWTAVATADSVDGVIGFSEVLPGSYGDFDLKIIFKNNGFIQVSDSSDFEADSMVAYVADQAFAFKMVADIDAQTYSVWVTPDGEDEILLAEAYAFKVRDDKTINSINYRCVKMSFDEKWGGAVGMVEITDFMTTSLPTEEYVVDVLEPQTRNFEATWTAVATADSVDGVLGFSEVLPASYGDFDLKILFKNNGYIMVSDSGDFEADSMVTYVADQAFAFKMVVEIDAQTYSVWVTPEGEDEILLAEAYAFKVRDDKTIDSINYRCVKMSFDDKWGGAVGMVEIADFMAILLPTEDYVVDELEPQTHNFEATWNAVATADSVDGVIGFSEVLPASYGDFDLKILFKNNGYIMVSDSADFEADSMVAYVADQAFAFKMVADIDAQTYSVWVTPEGEDEILLAEGYAFKVRDDKTIDSINYRCLKLSFDDKWGGNEGMVGITDFEVVSVPSEEYIITEIEPQTLKFEATWNAVATADSVDGVLGFSEVLPGSYGDFDLKILFKNNGYIMVSDSGDFEADSMVAYVADQAFAFRMVADIDAQTYSVWVTPEGEDEILLAEAFAFKVRDDKTIDSINYLCVKMSFDDKWGGAVGMVEITDFEASSVVSIESIEITNPGYSMRVFPNPMSISTTVEIYNQYPEDQIDLSIYNMMGQKVVNLFNGYQRSELQTYIWNGTNSSGQHVISGIYLLQLRSNKYLETIRIQVLK